MGGGVLCGHLGLAPGLPALPYSAQPWSTQTRIVSSLCHWCSPELLGQVRAFTWAQEPLCLLVPQAVKPKCPWTPRPMPSRDHTADIPQPTELEAASGGSSQYPTSSEFAFYRYLAPGAQKPCFRKSRVCSPCFFWLPCACLSIVSPSSPKLASRRLPHSPFLSPHPVELGCSHWCADIRRCPIRGVGTAKWTEKCCPVCHLYKPARL